MKKREREAGLRLQTQAGFSYTIHQYYKLLYHKITKKEIENPAVVYE